MTEDVTDRVKTCSICEKYNKKSQQKEPLLQHEMPSRPFEKIAADIFFLDGQNFLLVADYYSKMPKVQNQIPHIIRHTHKSEHIQNQLLARQNTQKTYFDQHRKELLPLIDNQQVSVQDTTTGLWSPATIIKSCGEPKSYVIQTPDGTTLRRNRRHLKDNGRSQHAVPVTQPTDDDDHGDDDTLDNPADSTSDDPGKMHGRPPVLSTGPPNESVTWANASPTTRSNSSTASTRSGRAVKPPKRFE
ncbi:hypothetical protein RRG08_041670 [Elysia crispata]|uniref:Integrase zinc-binding domain-containing protein n=1 Tax=Elysia crispata TaxID=231223 RepID=A0AAE0YBX6_9GAST|nr:hypothetical protein RRG08_041670 [Elysia crispata]